MPRRVTRQKLHEIFQRLLDHYGPQYWWPAACDFEMMLGAVLVQNTSWQNALRAIEAIRAADLLDLQRLYALPNRQLSELLKSCGYYRVKAKRLRNLLRLVVDDFGGELDRLWSLPTDELRATLLSVNGIGPETADCLMLYGARKPRFVVDKYTWRVLTRHDWIDPKAKYAEIQQWFEHRLAADVPLFNEFHALLVKVGNDRCRATPRCEGCPLECLLPRGGPQ